MVSKFFNKKLTYGSGVANNDSKQNLKLAEELHKPIIINFTKSTVYLEFKDNLWSTDLADMQLISKLDEVFRFLLYIIDIFSKYA